ncbi:MAG: phosphotransferase [Patescibacteria group bacterium]|nr:phosphotransferase [Patescibacteria group bacterium]
MNDLIIDIVSKNYNVSISKILKLAGGFRNLCFEVSTGSKRYVFIIYKRESKIRQVIENSHFVAKLLDSYGFITRIPVLTCDKEEYKRVHTKEGYHYCALYDYLEGETIPWEAYTRRHLKSIGKTLSDMHYALRGISMTKSQFSNNNQISISNTQDVFQKLPKWQDLTEKEIEEMKTYFEKVEPWIIRKLKVGLNWKMILKVLDSVLRQSQPKAGPLTQAILHYDFVRGNILFSDKLDKKLDIYPIIGILDFEKVCVGPVIADIARTLAFLIIDCKYKKEATVRKRFLISGYNKRGKNSLSIKSINSPGMVHLLSFFWLRDFWKFLEHNPYEFLHMNEHYVRTRDKLLAYGLMGR